MLVLVLVLNQLFGQLFSQLVVIQPLSDAFLALSRSARNRMSCLSSVAWSVDGSWLSIHSAFGHSIVLGLGLPVRIVCDYWLFCITVLDCLWLHQAVVCQVCRAIVRDFDWSVGQSVSTLIGCCFWYHSCNYFPERFKT